MDDGKSMQTYALLNEHMYMNMYDKNKHHLKKICIRTILNNSQLNSIVVILSSFPHQN